MGLVEEMLAISSARVLALYPSNDPVQLELSALTTENKKRNKKNEEVTKKKRKKSFVLESEKNHRTEQNKEIGQVKVEVKEEYFEEDNHEKISDTDNDNKTEDSKKVKIEFTEYEFTETKTKYSDEKKELLKVKKEENNYEVTTPAFVTKKEISDCQQINATSEAISKRTKDKSISIIKRSEENVEFKKKHEIKKINNTDSNQNITFNKSPGSNKQNDETIEDNKDKLVQEKVFRKSGNKMRTFSTEEDEVLLKAMESLGDKLNINSLAKELCTDRSYMSIKNRIDKLKVGGSQRKVRRLYSLTEDLVIMDKVLVELHGKKLDEISLYKDGTLIEVANGLGRTEGSLRNRWGNQLKPWILQHYSGTLNLDIKRMLANFLSDNFDSIESINWSLVAKRPEFVGHTLGSLSAMFFASLFKVTKRKINLENEKISLKHVAETYNSGKSSPKVFGSVLTRQKKVIDFFEQYVKKHDITHFL